MKELRIFLPFYRKAVKRMSKGYGIGKTRPGRLMLKIVTRIIRSDFVEVQGHNMFVIPGNEDYSLYGVYGELDTETVNREIKKGDIVVDVGASIGYFTLLFARAVGPEGKVFAFEPKPERFELLKKNVEINGYHNVTLENMAVMDYNGKSDFYYSKNGVTGFKLKVAENSPTREKIEQFDKGTAKTIRLEDYFDEKNLSNKINFIKSDVDGPELSVLQSAGSILKNKSLKIFFEWDVIYIKAVGNEPEEILELLYKNNFKIYSPDFKNQKFTEVSENQLLGFKNNKYWYGENLLCKKE